MIDVKKRAIELTRQLRQVMPQGNSLPRKERRKLVKDISKFVDSCSSTQMADEAVQELGETCLLWQEESDEENRLAESLASFTDPESPDFDPVFAERIAELENENRN